MDSSIHMQTSQRKQVKAITIESESNHTIKLIHSVVTSYNDVVSQVSKINNHGKMSCHQSISKRHVQDIIETLSIKL